MFSPPRPKSYVFLILRWRHTRSILSSETSPAPGVRPQHLTHLLPSSFLTILSSSGPLLHTYLKEKHFPTLISSVFYSQSRPLPSQIDSLGFKPTTSPLSSCSAGPGSPATSRPGPCPALPCPASWKAKSSSRRQQGTGRRVLFGGESLSPPIPLLAH